MRVTEPSPFGALLKALHASGLTRAEFDQWAIGKGRSPMSAMSLDVMAKTAAWITAGGAAKIRESAPTAAAPAPGSWGE